MPLQFYHLNRPPFQHATDLDFFWEGTNYVKSLDVLEYSLEHQGGLGLLTGKAGSGKSIIVRALLKALGNRVRAAVIPDSSLTSREFYDLVAHGFNLPRGMENRQDFHDHIRHLLGDARNNNQKVLLVVDEAQHLSRELIDELEELLRLQTEDPGGLGLCLVGQAESGQEPVTRITQAFEDQVVVRYHLAPLTQEETADYIQYRLKVAGADRPIFTEDAVQEIYRNSGGTPGRINILCDLALFAGGTEKAADINGTIVQMSAAKLQFPEVRQNVECGCTSVSALEEGMEDEIPDPVGSGGASPLPDEETGPVLPAQTGGRSFAVPVLAVVAGLVVLGGGAAVYLKRGVTSPPAGAPVTVERPAPVGTAAPDLPEAAKHGEDFDAVGYSPPDAEIFGSGQQVDGKTVTVTADEADLTSIGRVENTPGTDMEEPGRELRNVEPKSQPDRLEVQALQVEERISSSPVVVEKTVGSKHQKVSLSTETATVAPAPVETVDNHTGVATEETTAASDERESTVAQKATVVPEPELKENRHTAAAVQEQGVPAPLSLPAAGAVGDDSVHGALKQVVVDEAASSPVEKPVEKETPPAGTRKPELEHFFEEGGFVSQSPPSAQKTRKSRQARVVGPSPHHEIQTGSTLEPDPEDVIDWLLKKKEQNAH